MTQILTRSSGSPMFPVYIVMGVSGAGKTTVAAALSEAYGCIFMEGDDFHSDENVKLMSAGAALTDQDRAPWLRSLASAGDLRRREGVVFMTCSALKRAYRDVIRETIPDASFIYLEGGAEYIGRQMARRKGHFMPVSLLCSQFDSLEPLCDDEAGVTVCIERGVSQVIAEAQSFVGADIGIPA